MNGLYLGIGGNAGNRREFLAEAKKEIGVKIGPILKESSIYKTAAWGKTDQPDFFNQVLYLSTKLSAQSTLKTCLEIEKKLGRNRTEKWAARTIDIDILFFNHDIIKSKKLTVPHPHIQDRNFVLEPLLEIAPHLIHPVFRKKIFTLHRLSPDLLPVEKL